MSGKIPRTFIDDLLLRVDIVDLIDSHVPLKKTGSNYVARCPFHNEKSPSFSVNRVKQFYHCFGCGAGGNAINFVMDFNHLNFVEAIEDLAAFAGVQVPREVMVEREASLPNLSSIYDVLRQVADYYVEQLRSSPQGKQAVAYLKDRGVDGKVATDFLLGYAPGEWQGLESHFPRQALLDTGLLVVNEHGRHYDRFRDRVMFPIRDKRGRVIAFGARVLDDSTPKYLNSPETEVFQKGREVYGLHELLASNARPKRILLVEGYMDVIALAQAGVHYAVAALGTATSKAHLDLLFRYTVELVLCFDGDDAGRKAAWRAMDVVFPSLKEGRQVRIMLLPQGQDPDSLVRDEGVEAFENRVGSAQTLSEYFFQYLSVDDLGKDIEGRARVVETAQPYISSLADGVFKDMMQSRLVSLTSAQVVPSGAKASPVPKAFARNVPFNKGQGRLSSARTAIALLLQNPGLGELVEQREIDWRMLDFPGVGILLLVVEKILEVGPINTAMLLEMFRGTPEYSQVMKLAQIEFLLKASEIETEFCGALDRLLEQGREKYYAKLFEKDLSELSASEREILKNMRIK